VEGQFRLEEEPMNMLSSVRKILHLDDPQRAARRQARRIRSARIGGAVNRADPRGNVEGTVGRTNGSAQDYQGRL
jgi:hypothetical protein